MNIVVFGAGAIGSLFGALISKKHNVTLIGISPHVNTIQKNKLRITGKTQINIKISAEKSTEEISKTPDLLLLTVKSYDTEIAIKQAKKIIGKDTVILSLQNGLDNIERIKKHVDSKKIIAGTTTHGVLFSKPGYIEHTGIGDTIIGELNSKKTYRIKNIIKAFNQAGIPCLLSSNILKEIWIKAIINSSINPLTTLFLCRNGYLLKNPMLKNIAEKVCEESTNAANTQGLNLSNKKMFDKTIKVIKKTSENYSSMLQSFKNCKKTEIDSINGKLVSIGKKQGVDMLLNEVLFHSIKNIR